MKITIAHFGKIKDSNIRSLIDEFAKRLSRFPEAKLSFLEFKEDTQRNEEARIIELIEKNSGADFYLMDEFGKGCSSIDFAKMIESDIKDCKDIFFFIGDAIGFSDAFKRRFTEEKRFALSQMTFTHEVAIFLLTEQIYRSITLIRGIPYHKA